MPPDSPDDAVGALLAALDDHGFGPYFGTPCGILAPLYQRIADGPGVHTVAREDNAVGIAAGVALAGARPVVLMQNSGLGQSVNALASLVMPYRIPMLMVVSLRGVAPDDTGENTAMGALTEPILTGLGMEVVTLDARPKVAVDQVADVLRREGRAAALLVPPTLFGWLP